ncbi:hypothetical protein GN956_G23705 [Arapaima gigas]
MHLSCAVGATTYRKVNLCVLMTRTNVCSRGGWKMQSNLFKISQWPSDSQSSVFQDLKDDSNIGYALIHQLNAEALDPH